MSQFPLGISCVICTHNGSGRIEPTLRALQKQTFPKSIPCEVLVIDNASSDDTENVVRKSWNEECGIALRVVREEKLGLAYARDRAWKEVAYPIVSFIDDDVRVCESWVELASTVMADHPDCGALGGLGVGQFTQQPPSWFSRHCERYVIGPQGFASGDVTETGRTLWGAGLTVRVSAMQRLIEEGFSPLLVGRQGKNLSCGEDTELSLALSLAGWRIHYDARMTYEHFLPPERVNWSFLRRWYRGYGAASVALDAYIQARDLPDGKQGVSDQSATWKIAACAYRIMKDPARLYRACSSVGEGDDSIVWLEYEVGRLGQLLRENRRYEENLRLVREASWRRNIQSKNSADLTSGTECSARPHKVVI